MFEAKAKELGIELPDVPAPLAAYIPAIMADKFVYTSGQIPMMAGALKYKGKVGADITEDEGYDAARLCAINALSAVKSLIGSLDKIDKIVKLVVFVNSAPGLTSQPKIANGASELIAEIFGESGKHVRSAVGVCELPIDAAVEVELIALVK